jgi:hypothetical protein
VLDCFEKKDPDPVPKTGLHSYAIRYYYGIVSPGAEAYDELEVVVYNADASSGTLYYAYIKGSDSSDILLGEIGTVKQEKGVIVPDEIVGGLATYYEELKLLRILAKRPVTTILDSNVTPGSGSCHGFRDEVGNSAT